ncbi:MAG: LptF/LptG family permease, partial [Rhodospirillales bacterium]|nr:LptF/LptG family permease [Rhodospirillales bacterium]
MSLMLGVMLGFNQLSRDGEIDAFQASGLGIRRQARVAVVIAVLITAFTALILGYVKPLSRYAYQSVVYAATETALDVLLRPKVFVEMGATTVFIDGIRPETGTFANVFLYEGTERDGRGRRFGDDHLPRWGDDPQRAGW